MLRGGLVVIALVWLGGLTDLPQLPFWRNALSSKPLQQAALYAKDYMPEKRSMEIDRSTLTEK
jgi:membrane protein required for colicin V production